MNLKNGLVGIKQVGVEIPDWTGREPDRNNSGKDQYVIEKYNKIFLGRKEE